ncbi:MAG: putative transport system ATP-binding protein [Thermotogaceae bacterium]|nr:putative transport system ATP-binding protein [Thermotogaceae bacterium]
MEKTEVLVKTIELSKVYGSGERQVHALKNINIEIFKGEVLAIVGPSGCGKTTLLNCLSGIDNPTSGDVYINGFNITEMNETEKTEFRGKYMGFIFQFYNLIPVLNAVENVEVPLLARNVPPKIARKKAMELLKAVNLGHRYRAYPEELSGGEQQRVAVARALISDPLIIWADEPTGALDTRTGSEIVELLINLNRMKGTSLVIVTHDERITRYADRVMYMDSGKIVSTVVLSNEPGVDRMVAGSLNPEESPDSMDGMPGNAREE